VKEEEKNAKAERKAKENKSPRRNARRKWTKYL